MRPMTIWSWEHVLCMMCPPDTVWPAKVPKPLISSDARRHLKWCHHLSQSLQESWWKLANLTEEVSPRKTYFLYTVKHTTVAWSHSSFSFAWDPSTDNMPLTYTNPVILEDNPFEWWKQHGHLFPTLSRLARRYLTIPATSWPADRVFLVAGQVHAARRASLSPRIVEEAQRGLLNVVSIDIKKEEIWGVVYVPYGVS
jgi:hypothetical protein